MSRDPYQCYACGVAPLRDLGSAPDGRLFRCPDCGTLRLVPFAETVAPDTANKYGDAYRGGADPGKLDRIIGLLNEATDDIAPGSSPRLLDVGCSDGGFLLRVRNRGWRPAGVDPDVAAIEIARSQGLRVFPGTIDGAELTDEVFDIVTLWDVLEHIPDPAATASRLAGIVRPGGKVVVLTPNAHTVVDILARLERRLTFGHSQRLMNICVNRYHLHRFTRAGLERMFQRAGFELEKTRPVQVLSLRPEKYLSGLAPGIPGWTRIPRLDRALSRAAYFLGTNVGIKNKLLYVGIRQPADASPPAEVESWRPDSGRQDAGDNSRNVPPGSPTGNLNRLSSPEAGANE